MGAAEALGVLLGHVDGHAQVVSGGVAAMVDLYLNPWDAAPAQVLTTEAGGRCVEVRSADDKLGLIFGSPALVEQLTGWYEEA